MASRPIGYRREDFEKLAVHDTARALVRMYHEFKVPFNHVENTLDFNYWLYTTLNESIIRNIWYNDGDSVVQYVLSIWSECKYPGAHDVFRFYASLDELSRRRLVQAYNLYMEH